MIQKWDFDTHNVRLLWNKLSENDKKLLPFDITSFNWFDGISVYIESIKRYVLKDDINEFTIKKSQRHIKRFDC